MPLAFHPNQSFEISLAVDESLPPDQRPTFICRFLTVGEFQEAQALYMKAHAKETPDEEYVPLLGQILATSIRGWKRMRGHDGHDIPYSAAKLRDVLTEGEHKELAKKAAEGSALAEAERFLFKSQSCLEAGTTAGPAQPGSNASSSSSEPANTSGPATAATVPAANSVASAVP